MKKRLFGTDGVRGIANKDLSAQLAYLLGKSGAIILKNNINKKTNNTNTQKESNDLGEKLNNTIIVGTDTRESADLLSCALTAGILSTGTNVINVGIIPTPAIPFLVRKYNASAGVMISASHNPYEYNGIKFFDHKGLKLSDKVEDQIQSLTELYTYNNFDDTKTNITVGKQTFCTSGLNDYINFLLTTIDGDLKSLKIGLDCGNGATYKIAESVFIALGATVYPINVNPNGRNINLNCGSTNLTQLKELVLDEQLDMGFAFDGDGDRCLAVDNIGSEIDGDKILAICGLNMKKKGTLSNNTIVSTVMSNMGFIKTLNQNDVRVLQTKVGDKYVLEEMLNNDYNLGGEQSGHIIFKDFNTTGDGLITALQLASVCKNENEDLHTLGKEITYYPQKLINVHIDEKIKDSIFLNDSIITAINSAEKRLKDQGRVLVRVSGTEPLVRIMVECFDEALTNEIALSLKETFAEYSN